MIDSRRRKRNILFLFSALFLDRVSFGHFIKSGCIGVGANVIKAYSPSFGFPRPRQSPSRVARRYSLARCGMGPGEPRSSFHRTVFHPFPRISRRAKRHTSRRISHRLRLVTSSRPRTRRTTSSLFEQPCLHRIRGTCWVYSGRELW